MRIIRFAGDDPYLNLALERRLFENGDPAEELLLLYVNRPAVVIGRSQNPFRECSLPVLAAADIALVRRYTGGGTVYHDPGNLNFALLSSRERYDKRANARRLLEALSSLGIRGEVSERNDLLAEGRKFSGSAYRLTRERALHHGTLLVDADLSLLRRALEPSLTGIEGKGVLSVSSPVVALADIVSGLTVDDVVEALCSLGTGSAAETVFPADTLYAQVAEQAREIASWEWTFGRTPRFAFSLPLPDGAVRCEAAEGRIVAVEPAESHESLLGKKVDEIGNPFFTSGDLCGSGS